MPTTPHLSYAESMAIDTKRSAVDLDQLTSTILVEGVDALGQLTDDPVAAVMGTLCLSFRDGSTRMCSFDRRTPLPPVIVQP